MERIGDTSDEFQALNNLKSLQISPNILSLPSLAHPRQTQMGRAGRNKILGKKKGKKIRGNIGGIEPQPKRGH
jgi:hypothetical protein